MTKKDSPRIPTNLRMLKILEAFADTEQSHTATDIGRQLGLPKPTIHRLCATLIEEGYLVQDSVAKGYRPGRKAREMATAILHGSSFHLARRQILQRLADKIGETVNFVAPEDSGMSYKDRIETNWAFRIQLPIGSNVPFHCTASGKTFLASLPKAERRRLVNVMQLEELTEHTLTDPARLAEELSEVAQKGYALDREEFMIGMVAASVPIQDFSGKYFASLAFHGPTQRISVERAIEMVPLLQSASKELQSVMFG